MLDGCFRLRRKLLQCREARSVEFSSLSTLHKRVITSQERGLDPIDRFLVRWSRPERVLATYMDPP